MIDYSVAPFDYPVFKDNMTTLKETSFDKEKNIYMTDMEYEAVNFDKVKSKYIENIHPGHVPLSNDALIVINGELFFVEFKNGNMRNSIRDVRRKNYDSLLILLDYLGRTISYSRENINYILVYNKQESEQFIEKNLLKNDEVQSSKSFDMFTKTMGILAKKNLDIFGLASEFEKIYFKKVYSFTAPEFEKFINESIIKKL